VYVGDIWRFSPGVCIKYLFYFLNSQYYSGSPSPPLAPTHISRQGECTIPIAPSSPPSLSLCFAPQKGINSPLLTTSFIKLSLPRYSETSHRIRLAFVPLHLTVSSIIQCLVYTSVSATRVSSVLCSITLLSWYNSPHSSLPFRPPTLRSLSCSASLKLSHPHLSLATASLEAPHTFPGLRSNAHDFPFISARDTESRI